MFCFEKHHCLRYAQTLIKKKIRKINPYHGVYDGGKSQWNRVDHPKNRTKITIFRK